MAHASEIVQFVEELKSRLEGMAKNLVHEVYGAEGMPWKSTQGALTPFATLGYVVLRLRRKRLTLRDVFRSNWERLIVLISRHTLAQLRQQMVYRPGFLGVGGRKSSLHFVVNL